MHLTFMSPKIIMKLGCLWLYMLNVYFKHAMGENI